MKGEECSHDPGVAVLMFGASQQLHKEGLHDPDGEEGQENEGVGVGYLQGLPLGPHWEDNVREFLGGRREQRLVSSERRQVLCPCKYPISLL